MYSLEQINKALDIYDFYKCQFFNKYSSLSLFFAKYYKRCELQKLLSIFNSQYEKNEDKEMLANKLAVITYDIVELFHKHRDMLQNENCDVTLYQLFYQIREYSQLIVSNSHAVICDIRRNRNLENAHAALKKIIALSEKLSEFTQAINH